MDGRTSIESHGSDELIISVQCVTR